MRTANHSLDKEAVRAAYPVEDVIGETIELRRRGRELVGPCPFHDDEHPSLNVNVKKQAFLFRACGEGGDVFAWVEKLYNVTFNEALHRLADSNGHREIASRQASKALRAKPRQDEIERLTRLSDEEAMRRLREERHLLPKTLEHFGVEPNFEAQAWTYPVEGGQRFKHYHGRTPQRDKYWCTPGVNNQLYGLADVPDGAKRVVWANGELAVMACWQNDVTAVCGFGEGLMPDGAAEALLAKRAAQVLVTPDRDDAGQKGATKTAQALADAGLTVTIGEIPPDWVEGIESADVGDLASVFRSPAQFGAAIDRIAGEAKPVAAFAHSATPLGRTAHVEGGQFGDCGDTERSRRDTATVEVNIDGGVGLVAPADSLARVRKHVMDRVARGEVTVVRACQDAGISRSRFYELRARYRQYGDAGLRPKPRPRRPDRRLPPPLVDAIVAYAVEHPTEGPRGIAARLRVPRFGGWQVSHGGVSNVLKRAGLNRTLARLAAAEALAASEGGPLTERTLRDLRALERGGRPPPGQRDPRGRALRRHDVRRQPQGRGQDLAIHGRGRRLLLRLRTGRGRGAPRGHRGAVLGARRAAGLPPAGHPGAASHRGWRSRVQSRFPRRLSPPQGAAAPAPAAQPRSQRLRGTLPGHLSAPALPGRLPLSLLHPGRRPRCRSARLAALSTISSARIAATAPRAAARPPSCTAPTRSFSARTAGIHSTWRS